MKKYDIDFLAALAADEVMAPPATTEEIATTLQAFCDILKDVKAPVLIPDLFRIYYGRKHMGKLEALYLPPEFAACSWRDQAIKNHPQLKWQTYNSQLKWQVQTVMDALDALIRRELKRLKTGFFRFYLKSGGKVIAFFPFVKKNKSYRNGSFSRKRSRKR